MPGGTMGAVGAKPAVSATWLSEVQADSPAGLWLMQEASGTTMTATTGNDGTYTASGRTPQTAGPGKAALPYAMGFNGSSGAASVTHNFGSNRQVTFCCWTWWDTLTGNDDLMLEYAPPTSAGVMVNPNGSGGTFDVVEFNGTSSDRGWRYSRSITTAAAWHHYAFTFDRGSSWQVKVYVDGVLKSGTLATSGSWPGSDFSNSSLFLMSRGASTLFAAGRMCGVSVHHSILSGERIAAHYAGA